MRAELKTAAVLLVFAAPARARDDLDYFPADYHDSVRRFQDRAARVKAADPRAESGSIRVPGREDDDLEMDYLYAPAAEPRDLLVITSGVHGMEAFPGSAVQQMFVDELLPRADGGRLGVLLVHAVNPYGFKHLRRVDENNVDLNRNFGSGDALFKRENKGYEALAGLLEPRGPVGSPARERLETALQLALGGARGKYGIKDLSDAIGQGQHARPGGLEYGGTEPEPQAADLRALVGRVAAPYRRVVFVDVHSGLGAANQLHIMTGDGVSYSRSPLLSALLRPREDGGLYDLATGDDPGFYPTPGDIIDFLPVAAGAGKETVAVTAEFGTVGTGARAQLRTLNRVILENQGHRYGYASPAARREVEGDFRELFYPSDADWRRMVIEKSRGVLTRVVERLGGAKTPAP